MTLCRLFPLLVVVGCAAAPARPPAQPPAIDPRAAEIVAAMCELIQRTQAARIEVVDVIEEVDEVGQRLHYTHARTLTFARPGRLRLESTGDLHDRSFWKDGRTVTIFDADENIYAQIEDPGTLDQAIDLLAGRYGISLPMADLLSADPCAVLLEGVEQLRYVGSSRIDGVGCHHLAFRRPDIDFQLWVDEGPEPRVRRLVITYKALPGQPQYGMTIKSRQVMPLLNDATFAFVPPPGAEQVELVPIDAEQAP